MGNGDFSLKEEKGSFVNERALIKEDKNGALWGRMIHCRFGCCIEQEEDDDDEKMRVISVFAKIRMALCD